MVKICDLGILGKRCLKMCIDRWIRDMQHLEICGGTELDMRDGHEQAGTAFLSRLVADINSGVFANGISNVLWCSTRRDVEEIGNNCSQD